MAKRQKARYLKGSVHRRILYRTVRNLTGGRTNIPFRTRRI
jgi:hypothetical protein